jgi:uncharacterized membrane protein YheB (UPF0754 family)
MDWRAYIASVIADFQAHRWTYLSMPLIAALVGYGSKMLAVEMIFAPLEFIGIKPWFGWQGVVPRKAEKMARTAADLLLGRVLKPEDLIRRLDPQRIVKELEQPLRESCEDLVREIGEHFFPGFWMTLPDFARRAMIRRVQQEIPQIATELWQDIGRDVDRYLDVRHMLVSNLVKDRALLNRVLRKVGYKEFSFFRNAGLVFGFGLGLVQLVCWIIWHKPWLMPAFGAVVGFVSDWVALQLLFRPLQPKRILGFKVQGLFISRQKEVARDYAEIMAKQLLTPANLVEELLRGPFADRVVDLVQKHVQQATDAQLGAARPLVMLALGSKRFIEIRDHLVKRILQLLPETSKKVERYALDALDISNTIVARMELLTPEEFEGMLRPAFKEDEMTLITVGAVLGFLVGEIQIQLML